MTIHYKTSPKTFDELADSVRGQVERTRELSMKGEGIPLDECVTITSEAFLGMIERIETLTEMVVDHTSIFSQLEIVFKWIFNQFGLDIDQLIQEHQEGYEGYEG